MEIEIIPYQERWPVEFHALGTRLRHALGERALRIDHIGSTSVPGLAAKDIIDVQITVAALEPAVKAALEGAGFGHIERITGDHLPPGTSGDAAEWVKWIFKPAAQERPANIHVRLFGYPNGRYALLFRDYLRAHPAAAEAYAQVKIALARLHPNDKDAYYDVKDPVCNIIMEGAEAWAQVDGWNPGKTDC